MALQLEMRPVTVLKVFSPNCFLIKELASPEIPTSTAHLFSDLETQYLNKYDLVDIVPSVVHLPLKGSYVLVKPEKDCQWYRGRVEAILETLSGARVNTYLLDYGRHELVRKEWVREMPAKYHQVPFQAVEFILPNLQPCSLTPSDQWDISAVEDIKSIVRVNKTVTAVVEHSDKYGLHYGQLIVEHQGTVVNVNEYLLSNRFATDVPSEIQGDCQARFLKDGMWAWIDSSRLTLPNDALYRSRSSASSRVSRLSICSSRNSSGSITPSVPQRTCHSKQEAVESRTDYSSDSSVPERPKQWPAGCKTSNPAVGRGQKLLNMSFEMQHQHQKKNLTKISNGSRSSTHHGFCSVSESGSSSTLSVSFDSQDEDTEIDDIPLPQLIPANVNTKSSPERVHHFPQAASSPVSLPNTSRVTQRTSTHKKDPISLPKTSSGSASSGYNFVTTVESSDPHNILPHRFISPKCHVKSSPPGSRASSRCSSSHAMLQKKLLSKIQVSNSSNHATQSQDVNVKLSPRNESQNGGSITYPQKNCDSQPKEIKRNAVILNQERFSLPNSEMVDRKLSLGDATSTILRFGDLIPKPVQSVPGSALPDALIQRLEYMQFPGPSITQSNAWPAALRGRSVAVIAPKHSGKTLACLLPLLSFILQPEDYQILETCTGPLVVVLCSSWQGCHNVYSQCRDYLPDSHHNKVVCMFGGSGVENKFSVVGRCDLLITTPKCYLDIQKTVAMDRCCHVMLDDADVLTECFTEQIREIMVSYVEQYKSHGKKSLPSQVLLCSSQCTSGVQSFIRKMMLDPVILISSFLEAAIYARVPVYPKATTKCRLSTVLAELLHDGSRRKTVVCTTSGPVALEVADFMKSHSVYCLVAHEELEHFNMKAIKSEWEEPSSSAVLIVSDYVLPEMQITSAEWLIHYDLPDQSRLIFGYRFACLARSMQARVNIAEDQQQGQAIDCASHILLTPDYEVQSVDLIRFFKRLGVECPNQLLELGARKQLSKKLCPKLQAFGRCKLKNWCGLRHQVKKGLDDPLPGLPQWGEATVHITHVLDGSHFYGRLLRFSNPVTGDISNNQDKYLDVQCQLIMHFAKAAKVKEYREPTVGDICAIYKPGDTHHRVQVIEIHEVSAAFMLKKATVFYVDEGMTEDVEVGQLLALPAELASFPPQAISIYACGVQPIDGNQLWTKQAGCFIHQHITDKEIHGKVVLCLKDALLLESLVIRSKVLNSTYVNTFNYNQEIVKQGFAMQNSEHVSLLKEQCKDEISFQQPKEVTGPTSSTKAETTAAAAKIQGMCTENKTAASKDTTTSCKQSPVGSSCVHKYQTLSSTVQSVFVSIIENPELFYVQPVEMYNALQKLNGDINKLVTEDRLKPASNIIPGCVCLSPFGENSNSWFRAGVVRVESDNRVQLFFVDYGDTGLAEHSELFEIPTELLELPFQAVECSLAGISPVSREWEEETTCVFMDLTREDDDIFKEMQLQVLESLPSKLNPNRTRYSVKLWERHSKPIASQLVDKSLARKCLTTKASEYVSENEADCEYSPASTPEPDEAQFCSALVHNVLGQGAQLMVETSDDESVQMAVKRTLRKPTSQNVNLNQNTQVREISVPISPCDMPRMAVVENFTKCLTPHIQWYQTEKELILMVQVDSYQEYDFLSSSSQIILKILKGDRYYSIQETLYEKVVANLSESFALGHMIKIKLQKLKRKHWPRLIKKTERVRHIAVHPDHLATTTQDEDESVKSFPVHSKDEETKQRRLYHFDPCNMDDQNFNYTESDSDWARENAHDMFS